MLATIIAKLGLPMLIGLIGGALGRVDNPVAQSAANALNDFQSAFAQGAITAEQMAEANRHAEELASIKSKEYQAALAEINQSLRAEAGSDDPYVRRMRPTFGYLMAITWAVQMLALAYIVVFETDKAPAVLNGMDSLTTIWGVGLSVLGIYVYKRSEDKKLFAPVSSPAPQAAATQNPKSPIPAKTGKVNN